MWNIYFTKKASKQLDKLPHIIQDIVVLWIDDVRKTGPYRGDWPNFSKLSKSDYHCHLKKGQPTYVICWRIENKKIKVIEVYYVGTHEKAPY